jgi:hypothetical protein
MVMTDEEMDRLGQMKRWNGWADEEMEWLGQMKRWIG